MKRSNWKALFVVLVGVLGITSMAFAQGKGKGGGGGRPGGETTANSVSVPAIFVGVPKPLIFPIGPYVEPVGAPLTGFPIDESAYYFVQGVHQWQATTAVADAGTVDVHAAWGDNLNGDAKLKTNSPIRVEMGLLADLPELEGMRGWSIEKLDEDLLDREAPYGTLAVLDEGTYRAVPIDPFPEVRVHDDAAWLFIANVDTGKVEVDEPASAEVNSTGRIVYGYNLRVPLAGTYVISFTAPSVDILDPDGGVLSEDGHTVSLFINVVAGGGQGGGGGKGHNK
ncbi:MAG: hypothetical protein KDB23_32670 [Planctomycetales bacterium]|nr:hypothetical protein [Planctomycetales bacterium]